MKGNINRITAEYPQTKIWMDSMKLEDLDFLLNNSNAGVTTAPSVVAKCLAAEFELHIPRLKELIEEMPEASERKIFWAWAYETIKERSRLLLDLYGNGEEDNGHFAIQMNIFDYRNAEKMKKQADIVGTLFPNSFVKVPVTKAGLETIEYAVYKGYSVLATMSSSIDQVLAAAEAQKRGIERRKAEGKDCSRIALSCAMQMTVPEKCVINYAAQNSIDLSEKAKRYASIAVSKKMYHILKERGYKSKLMLSSFTQNENDQWREFMGGDIILTMPRWLQDELDENAEPVENLIDREIPEEISDELIEKIPFYKEMFIEGTMKPEDFEHHVPFTHIAQSFMQRYDEGIRLVRGLMLPNNLADSGK